MCSYDCRDLKWSVRLYYPNSATYISHTNALICNCSYFSPKIGFHGNAPLSLVYGSVTDEFPDSTNPISKPNTAWMRCIQLKLWPFFVFWPILAKIWLPWQRPLDSCNQKCLLWIAEPRKPPAISNNILVIYRRNVFVCIYSNFSPKNCCYGNAPFFPCVRECHRWIPRWHKPYLETKLCIDMSLTTEVMAILSFFGLFWPKFGCRGNVP